MPKPSGEPAQRGLLQRVIMPRPGDPLAVRSLYVDERTGIRLATVPPAPGMTLPAEKVVNLSGSALGARRVQALSRTSAVVREQSEVSFGAYFNAFAASYWRRWTPLTEVHLRLELEGAGRVDVYRTKADGSHIFEHGEVVAGPGRHRLDIAPDPRPVEGGGWDWVDLPTHTAG